MTASAILSQVVQLVAALAIAPLLIGWVNACRAWLSGRRAPPLTLTVTPKGLLASRSMIRCSSSIEAPSKENRSTFGKPVTLAA